MKDLIKVTLTPKIRLEQALKDAGVKKPESVTRLTIEGTITQDDLAFIKDKMEKTLKKLDLSRASVKKNIQSKFVLEWFTALTSVTLPNNITTIEDGAFVHCESLTSITIPNSVTEIGNGAFSFCDNLRSVFIPASVEKIDGRAFEYSPTHITVHPDNPVYKSTNGILRHKTILKMNSQMNIYDFFNSPDVAAYCQSIGHTFNAVESAVMVSQSKTKTMAEKLAAYRTIIAEYPDMALPDGYNPGYYESFHEVLEDFITNEEQLLEKFIKPEPNAVYLARLDKYDSGIFKSYEKAFKDALEHFEDEKYCIVRKVYIESDKYFQAEISKSGEIMDISGSYTDDIVKKNENFYPLLSVYIDVPVPFKRGDLVETDNDGWMGDVYVLQKICRDDFEYNSKAIYHYDLTDMNAGVHCEVGGLVRCEDLYFYPDLRYCRKELEGKQRILKYVSLHLQDKLCLCSLLKIQKYLWADEIRSELKNDGDLEYQLEEIKDKLLSEHE